MVTLSDQLICNTDDKEALLSHLVHILKVTHRVRSALRTPWASYLISHLSFQVILPRGVSYAEVGGASAVSRVCLIEVGGATSHSDAWLLLWEDGVSVHPVHRQSQQAVRIELSMLSHHGNSLANHT